MSTEPEAQDDWGALANRLDEDFPEAWRPGWKGKDGKRKPDADEIMGTLVRMEVAGTARGNDVPVAIIATHPEGELRALWLVHSTLREDLLRQRPAEGDRLAVRYLGKKESAQNPGQEYHAYKLAVMRRSTGVAAPGGLPTVAPDFGETAPY